MHGLCKWTHAHANICSAHAILFAFPLEDPKLESLQSLSPESKEKRLSGGIKHLETPAYQIKPNPHCTEGAYILINELSGMSSVCN